MCFLRWNTFSLTGSRNKISHPFFCPDVVWNASSSYAPNATERLAKLTVQTNQVTTTSCYIDQNRSKMCNNTVSWSGQSTNAALLGLSSPHRPTPGPSGDPHATSPTNTSGPSLLCPPCALLALPPYSPPNLPYNTPEIVDPLLLIRVFCPGAQVGILQVYTVTYCGEHNAAVCDVIQSYCQCSYTSKHAL